MKPLTEEQKERRRAYARVYSRAYRAANPDKVAAQKRSWRAAHPENVEKSAAYHREWHAAHPGYSTAQTRAWRADNPDKQLQSARLYVRVRRERKAGLDGIYVDMRSPGVCGNPTCPDPTGPGPWHDGHEPPIAWLAEHPEYNGPCMVRTEHAVCNFRKNARPDWELAA